MEHSAAIMDDVGRQLDKGTTEISANKPEVSTETQATGGRHETEGRETNNYDTRKRKGNFQDHKFKHGAKHRGDGRGGDRSGDHKRHKKADMGRAEYFRSDQDRRAKTASAAQRRREDENAPVYGTTFSKEEIDAEGRRPKRKVAVLIGYSGTGYKGMQISPSERTIEGELFQAFVKAGAISKANADDPKKASLVRCARTDKGVHAAGNMISLKLIVEEDDIVEKINAELDPQVRVWGIERTIGSFSCYQACDSRWYEYLIPTSAFLPPHPSSYLARQLERFADEAGDRDGYAARQEEVKGFWEDIDLRRIQPVLESIEEDIRWEVVKALQGEEEAHAKAARADADLDQTVKVGSRIQKGGMTEAEAQEAMEHTEEAAIIINDSSLDGGRNVTAPHANGASESAPAEESGSSAGVITSGESLTGPATAQSTTEVSPEDLRIDRLRAATKKLRQAYNAAKRQYRIPKTRIDRIQCALSKFIGTKNYHNYTIQKTYRDPSAKRVIKSFVVNPTPILIGDGEEADKTEWLSLKVHGQSFMMHQIRKMVGMVALLVRCGTDLSTMDHSFTEARYSIPKVPGLGLMLERPVFDSYNAFQATKHQREPLLFSKFDKEIEAFKHSEIYARMFREEEEKGEFGRFFNHVDNFREPHFLYVTSKGLDATGGAGRKEGYGEAREVKAMIEGADADVNGEDAEE